MAGCFVVGMILEDVSNKFVDDDTGLNKRGILTSDDEIKAIVFFGNDYKHSIHEEPLSYLAAKYGLLGRYGGADGAALESHILVKKQCQPNGARPFQEIQLDERVTRNVAKTFYYNAKSTSYKEASYYNELKKIQMRIDFSRSLIAVSVLITLVLFAGLLRTVLELLWNWWRGRTLSTLSRPERTGKVWAERVRDKLEGIPEFRVKLPRRPNWIFYFGLTLTVIFFAAKFAYFSEEREFNKRAYGYYIYHKINAENPVSVICQEVPVLKTLAGTSPQIAADSNNPNTCCHNNSSLR